MLYSSGYAEVGRPERVAAQRRPAAQPLHRLKIAPQPFDRPARDPARHPVQAALRRHGGKGSPVLEAGSLALDPANGPTTGCRTCRGVVTIDPKDGSVTRNIEYYAFGHASRFVKRDARRVDLLQKDFSITVVEDDFAALLGDGKLSMAMVDSVPAGQYGKQSLESLGLWPSVQGSVAQSENVRAALALVSVTPWKPAETSVSASSTLRMALAASMLPAASACW